MTSSVFGPPSKSVERRFAGSHVVIISIPRKRGISYIELTLRLVVGGGFEPPKASPTDLQSVPFDHSGTPPHGFSATSKVFTLWSRMPIWSQRRDSNPRPTDYKSVALPTELRWLNQPVECLCRDTIRSPRRLIVVNFCL